jgi:hypothetical protein
LLVSSATGSYDTEQREVIQMAAKIAFLDRVLGLYGPQAAEARASFHEAVQEAVRQMWPDEAGVPAHLTANESHTTRVPIGRTRFVASVPPQL